MCVLCITKPMGRLSQFCPAHHRRLPSALCHCLLLSVHSLEHRSGRLYSSSWNNCHWCVSLLSSLLYLLRKSQQSIKSNGKFVKFLQAQSKQSRDSLVAICSSSDDVSQINETTRSRVNLEWSMVFLAHSQQSQIEKVEQLSCTLNLKSDEITKKIDSLIYWAAKMSTWMSNKHHFARLYYCHWMTRKNNNERM